MEIALPLEEKFAHVEVNGVREAVKRLEDGSVVLTGKSAVGSPLRWAVG